MKNSLSHIAFIMDGNNRWSIKNNKSKFYSYNKGASNLINLTNFLFNKTNIRYVTAFALSSSNLKRPKNLVNIILKLLDEFLDQSLNQSTYNFSIEFIGDLNFLGTNVKQKIKTLEFKTSKHKKKLTILINYSGRDDICYALKAITRKNLNINSKNISKYLMISHLPDPDIIIRTGGFKRISDFSIFNTIFSEFFFTKILWPDFNINNLSNFIKSYHKIERKFGL